MRNECEALTEALTEQLRCEDADGSALTLAGALYAGLKALAYQVKYLGNGDASTPMGGLEALGVAIKEGCAEISGSLEAVAEAIANHESTTPGLHHERS